MYTAETHLRQWLGVVPISTSIQPPPEVAELVKQVAIEHV